MQPIKINVAGTLATLTQNVTLTTGLVGQTVAFTFDKAWDGLSRCAVFKAGNAAYTQLNIDEEATIPPELLRIRGRQVSVGVYGFNAEGTVVIPTVWTLLGAVKHGANPNGQESTTPPMPIWAQLAERCQKLEEQIGKGGGSASNPDHSAYFDIDVEGLISLKPEYRGATSEWFQEKNLLYSRSDQGWGKEGSSYNELPERLVIPNNVDGERVTGFQTGMFGCNHRIKEVVLPSGVKVLPSAMFREAIHLEKVENTEQLESIKPYCFYYARIEEMRCPNLVSLSGNAFTNCSRLVVADVGNITAIGNYVFEWCENLIEVLGGANVKTIGGKAFYSTRRLKKLSFLGNVTKIDNLAFYGSACDFEEVYDTLVANNCTFGNHAPTYKQFNDADYWSGFTPTPCKIQLRSVFHQKNPDWKDKIIGAYYRYDSNGNWETDENGDYILKDLPYSKGCSLLSLAEIYSAFEGVDFSSPEEFMDILRSKGLTDPADHNPLYRPQWCAIANGLGYTTEYITEMTTANYQKVCNALAEGALLYKSVGTASVDDDGLISENPDGGHATVVYGINSAGEMLMSDTSMHCYEIGIYENHKSAWHIYKHGSKKCDVVIVRKPKEE